MYTNASDVFGFIDCEVTLRWNRRSSAILRR
jgi:hypothetical protein